MRVQTAGESGLTIGCQRDSIQRNTDGVFKVNVTPVAGKKKPMPIRMPITAMIQIGRASHRVE